MAFDAFRSADLWLLGHVNGLAGDWPLLDMAVIRLSYDANLKGVLVMALFWCLWFLPARSGDHRRERLLAALAGGLAALIIGRLLTVFLPYRVRPLHDPDVQIDIAHRLNLATLDGFTSCPSDHASFFFALATGLFMVSRRFGAVALFHATFFIALPRVFLGYRYPSDVIAGALVGVVTALVMVPAGSRVFERGNIPGMESRYPCLFYPALFIVTFQFAEMFRTLYGFFKAGWRLLF